MRTSSTNLFDKVVSTRAIGVSFGLALGGSLTGLYGVELENSLDGTTQHIRAQHNSQPCSFAGSACPSGTAAVLLQTNSRVVRLFLFFLSFLHTRCISDWQRVSRGTRVLLMSQHGSFTVQTVQHRSYAVQTVALLWLRTLYLLHVVRTSLPRHFAARSASAFFSSSFFSSSFFTPHCLRASLRLAVIDARRAVYYGRSREHSVTCKLAAHLVALQPWYAYHTWLPYNPMLLFYRGHRHTQTQGNI